MVQVQKNTLRLIPDGESFCANNDYLGNRKMKTTFAIRRSADEPRYEKTILVDFSNVSEEQLLVLAMYGTKVRIQSMMRALDPAVMLNPDTMAEVDVLRDVVEAPAKASDPVSAAVRSLMKATGIDADAARAMLETARGKAEAKKAKAA